MKRRKWIAAGLALLVVSGLIGFGVTEAAEQGKATGKPPAPVGALRRAYWRAMGIKTAKLKIRVVDIVTYKGIDGAGCVVGETGDRIETDARGNAPEIDAPIFRHPRLEEMLAELHGQLTVMCYKNGYRDAIYMGVRMHEGSVTEPTVMMTPISQSDRRIEPTLFQMPIHRIWRIQLVDKYRLFEEGEGPESPKLSRPDTGVADPQEPIGPYPQTPPIKNPPPPQPVQPGR